MASSVKNKKTTKPTTTKSNSKKVSITSKNKKTPTNSKVKNIVSTSKLNHEVFTYICVKKFYLVTDPKTQEDKVQRMWIVIGKGHKRYRKFDTQAKAIEYFRALKKPAKMKVQSVNSNEYVKTVYTLVEMGLRGIDLKNIKIAKKVKKDFNNDEFDYEDEFSKFDFLENDDDDNLDFNSKEIDDIIAKQENVKILSDYDDSKKSKKQPTTKQTTKSVKKPAEKKSLSKVEQTTLLFVVDEKKEEPSNYDPYALTTEYEFETQEVKKTEQENTTTQAFSFVTSESKNLENDTPLNGLIEENDAQTTSETFIYNDKKSYYEIDEENDEIEEEKTDLYTLSSMYDEEKKPIESFGDLDVVTEDEDNEIDEDLIFDKYEEKINQIMSDDNNQDITMTQSTTQLTAVKQDDSAIISRPSKSKTFVYWIFVALISIALATIAVVAIVFATIK